MPYPILPCSLRQVSQLCRGLLQPDPSSRHAASEGHSLAAWFVSRLETAGSPDRPRGKGVGGVGSSADTTRAFRGDGKHASHGERESDGFGRAGDSEGLTEKSVAGSELAGRLSCKAAGGGASLRTPGGCGGGESGAGRYRERELVYEGVGAGNGDGKVGGRGCGAAADLKDMVAAAADTADTAGTEAVAAGRGSTAEEDRLREPDDFVR